MRRFFFFAVSLLFLALTPFLGSAAVPIQFQYIVEPGRLTLVGTHPDGEGSQVTGLVTRAGTTGDNLLEGDRLKTELLHIDQVTAGVNGGFIMPAGIGYLDEQVNIRMNGSGSVTVANMNDRLITSLPTVGSLPNNSLRIGNDVYDISNGQISSSSVNASLSRGGNILFYKVGGRWYNLLDGRARTSRFLKPANAVPDDVVATWDLDAWYGGGVFDFVD